MQTAESLFPSISRHDIVEAIRSELDQVSKLRETRAVVLQGEGGIGKSFFLRQLTTEVKLPNVVWLGPFDADDAENWLVPRLEERIARTLDPERRYFTSYYSHQLSRDASGRGRLHLEFSALFAASRKADRLFLRGYSEFAARTGKVPVLIFDTMESLRGLDLLPELVGWMSKLPSTLLVLASRPAPLNSEDETLAELKQRRLEYSRIKVGPLNFHDSSDYLSKTAIGPHIPEATKQLLAVLCDGLPLRLALAVDYLAKHSLLEDMSLDSGWDEAARRELRDELLTRIFAPYIYSDFWNEAVKRVGIVRRRVDKQVWRQLMEGAELPEDIGSWDEAWQRFQTLPWVRRRARYSYVTLHDAVAEELAKRVLPFHERQLCQRLWHQAALTYQALADSERKRLREAEAELTRPGASDHLDRRSARERLLHLAVEWKQQDLLVSTALYYTILDNHEAGLQLFLRLFDEGYRQGWHLQIQLLWIELQHFMPGDQSTFDPLSDIVAPRIRNFRKWYAQRLDYRYMVEIRIARFLEDRGRPIQALRWLDGLVEASSRLDAEREYELRIRRANALVRVSNRAREARDDFLRAKELAAHAEDGSELRKKLGPALGELGHYFRSIGDWRQAEGFYRMACAATPVSERVENAIVEVQYAYLLALTGRFKDAQAKCDVGMAVTERETCCATVDERARLLAVMAHSIGGEVYRFQRRYKDAWMSYEAAESVTVHLGPGANPWVGVLQQQKAICLHQACDEPGGIEIGDFISQAQRYEAALYLAELALDSCRRFNPTMLPMAFNRAGRIRVWPAGEVNVEEADTALSLFEQGYRAALEVGDRWMQIANLLEFVSLCCDMERESNSLQTRYSELFQDKAPQIRQLLGETPGFEGLSGRWMLLQAHRAFLHTMHHSDASGWRFERALSLYSQGYLKVAKGYKAARTLPALRSRAKPHKRLLLQLSLAERREWVAKLDEGWRALSGKEAKHLTPLSTFSAELELEMCVEDQL